MNADSFRFDGKRALVVGGATGMGAATAALVQDLGAEVVVMDHAEVDLPGVKAILSTSATGRASTPPSTSAAARSTPCSPAPGRRRHAGHRADQLHRAPPPDRPRPDADLLPRGSAIAMISSAAGLGWEPNLDLLKEYLDTPDFDSAVAWIEAHPEQGRLHVEQAGDLHYVARQALAMQKRGSASTPSCPARPTRLSPRPTPSCGSGSAPTTAAETGIGASTPEEQAGPLVFLCSDAARTSTASR